MYHQNLKVNHWLFKKVPLWKKVWAVFINLLTLNSNHIFLLQETMLHLWIKNWTKSSALGPNWKYNFFKNLTKGNECPYKRERNIYVVLRRKSVTKYFTNISKQGIITKKNFWKVIKPFLINKGHINTGDIVLPNDRNILTVEEDI